MDTLSIKKPQTELLLPLFAIVILSGLLLHYIIQEWILVPEVYYRSLASKLSDERIQQLITAKAELSWVGYTLGAIKPTLQVLLIALLLSMGAYFFGYKLPLKQAVGIALVAALVPIAAMATKTIWFAFADTPFTLKDFNQTELFSLKHLFFNEAPMWLSGILNWLGLFEIAYWGVLAVGLARHLKTSTLESVGMVGGSYGIAMLLVLSLQSFTYIWVM